VLHDAGSIGPTHRDRATLGIGAGWYQLEHDALGFEFGTFTDRFAKLEEALQIIIPMLRGETVTSSGTHYRTNDAVNSPVPLHRIPIMIGGSGEKKTLRMVAQYADESNLVGVRTTSDVSRKLDILAEHCARLDRDRSEIAVTLTLSCCIAPTMEEAVADVRVMGQAKGWSDEAIEANRANLIIGDPDAVGEQLTSLATTGIDGFGLSLAANGHIPGRLGLLGEVAGAVLTARAG
jgi:alkanesulfonate monooxygenase SsuD/methylene tetrahydromethanopterin reductase-like flavin-dependent oxidoreductase (luciferase family)